MSPKKPLTQQQLARIAQVLGLAPRPAPVVELPPPQNLFGGYHDQLDVEQEDLENDDFRELLRQKNHAAVAPNGAVYSDLLREARFQQQEHVRQDESARFVRINPVSAGNGTLGNTVRVTNDSKVLSCLNWMADSDIEATTLTVTIIPELDQEGAFNQEYTQSGRFNNRLFALVRWGHRAAPAVAEVDVGKGCQLTLSGTFATVGVGVDPGTSGTGEVAISAWMAFYGAPRTSPVTRTIYVDSLDAAANTGLLHIPTFARQLQPVQRQPLSNAFTIDFYDKNQSHIYRITGGGGTSSFMSSPLMLTQDSYFIRVTNDGLSTLTSVRLPFELGF